MPHRSDPGQDPRAGLPPLLPASAHTRLAPWHRLLPRAADQQVRVRVRVRVRLGLGLSAAQAIMSDMLPIVVTGSNYFYCIIMPSKIIGSSRNYFYCTIMPTKIIRKERMQFDHVCYLSNIRFCDGLQS